MEFQLDSEKDQIIITLSHDECIEVGSGQTLTDRGNPYDPLAKIDVRPLSDIDPTYRPLPLSDMRFLSRLGSVSCRAVVLGNNDIIVYVPEDLARSAYVAAEDITYPNIDGSEEVIPQGGIRIEFGQTIGRHNRQRIES